MNWTPLLALYLLGSFTLIGGAVASGIIAVWRYYIPQTAFNNSTITGLRNAESGKNSD